MEPQAGGLGLSEVWPQRVSWHHPTPASPLPLPRLSPEQAGHPELPHRHPGAHPSSCHMFTTQISQQLPPPRSLPLTLEGGVRGHKHSGRNPKHLADHFLPRLHPDPPAPLICVYKQHQAPTASPGKTPGKTPGFCGAAQRNIRLDRAAALSLT